MYFWWIIEFCHATWFILAPCLCSSVENWDKGSAEDIVTLQWSPHHSGPYSWPWSLCPPKWLILHHIILTPPENNTHLCTCNFSWLDQMVAECSERSSHIKKRPGFYSKTSSISLIEGPSSETPNLSPSSARWKLCDHTWVRVWQNSNPRFVNSALHASLLPVPWIAHIN